VKRWLAGLGLLFAIACASAPRPRILTDVDRASLGAQAAEAKALAPQAHAHAELLRGQAARAHAEGDPASTQILSEHALAAYAHAFVLARLTRAERELDKARVELEKAQAELADLDEKQKRAGADADDLELRVKVAEDAIPLAPNVPASPEREKARLDAARSLVSQARLLCMAAKLLDAQREGLGEDTDKVRELEKTLSGTPKVAPIDAAVQARSACLKQVTLARRASTRAAPAAGVADALLAELSHSGTMAPFRDDRGVVVTLRGLYAPNGALSHEGQTVLETLGRVAKAHPEFPLLVVIHGGKAAGEGERRGRLVTEALIAAGAPRAEASYVGNAQPVVDPARAAAARRNERVEIVFVAPSN
jgi:hypothetical protein